MQGAYLGPRFSDGQIEETLNRLGAIYRRLPDDTLYPELATVLDDGGVVGWFQGRMEFGPRALGNRSIVADPRRPDMKDILNSRIKHREPFKQ